MRRVAWVVVVVLAVAALAVPAWEPALAQPATVPTPDFDHDGFGDLAVGVPGEDVGGDGDAGAVVVLFGSAGGLGGGRLLTQANPEPGDRFGSSLDTGELTDAGQLLVGAPGEDVRGVVDAGAVSLVSSPASDPDEELLYQGIAGITGTAEAGDAFGHAVAVGDFNSSDGIDSLAVGAPGEDVADMPDAGVVNVRYAPGFGGPGGLRQLTQDRPEAGDRFGSALAEGSIDPVGGYADLAVGAPGETVGGRAGAGAVSLVLAGDSGFTAAGGRLFHQGAGGVPGAAEAGDRFGTAVAVGAFSGEGNALAVGVPGEDVGTAADAGVLDVLDNSGAGLGGGGRQLTQADAGGAVEPGDRFGAALSAPFFHGTDVLEDLGAGAPGETVAGRAAAGAGTVLFGDGDGLGAGGSQLLRQGIGGLGGAPEPGDVFGAALG
jgi:FG-GAP repeat